MIELHSKYASMAEVSLFGVYGFQSKAILLMANGKPEAANYHQERKLDALDTALTLAAEMPELTPELLMFAIQENKHREALSLIEMQQTV